MCVVSESSRDDDDDDDDDDVQAFFKDSELRVLNDSPVSSYGRARRLLLTDGSDHKQRRRRWEADLAKAAISCTHIDTYRYR